MKTILIFGSFDGLHEGHRYLIIEAKQLGDRLVVALATDNVIALLKDRSPQFTFDQRRADLLKLEHVDEVIEGDDDLSKYAVIEQVKPDVVAFGYDQDALQRDFQRFAIDRQLSCQIVTLSSYKPEIYKSSLLRKG